MKKLMLVLMLSVGVNQLAFAQVETTSFKNVGQVQVAGSGVTVQPTSGSWGSRFCQARYGFLSKDHASYKDILATFLTTKVSGDRIAIRGTCDSSNGLFFNVDRIIVQ